MVGLSIRDSMANKLNNSRRTIAVDFDGVIADYDGYKGAGVLGAPREDVRAALRQLRVEGWKIVIHTTRGPEEVGEYLVRNEIPHDEINHNSDYRTLGTKPVADIYWDDRAVRYSGDAGRDLEVIRSFRTWSGRD
jgi:hydroxymethylpyrimidine pyrophosphatase-like HAD family hydrolase